MNCNWIALEMLQDRKLATWRRRSEPSREPHVTSVMDMTDAESTSEWHDPKTDDETEDSSGHRPADGGLLPDSDLRSETCTPQRCPESLEHIVEQLVLQNVEIQRILQRQKRRAFRNTSAPRPVRNGSAAAANSGSSFSASASFSTASVDASAPEPIDEGIYDSLILSPVLIADGDGEYVSIRADESLPLAEEEEEEEAATVAAAAAAQAEGKSHFSRCQMRSIMHSAFRIPHSAFRFHADPGRILLRHLVLESIGIDDGFFFGWPLQTLARIPAEENNNGRIGLQHGAIRGGSHPGDDRPVPVVSRAPSRPDIEKIGIGKRR